MGTNATGTTDGPGGRLGDDVLTTVDHANAKNEKVAIESGQAIAEKRDAASIEDESDKAPLPPYSVFTGWERYSIVAMVAAASLFR